MDHVTLGIVIKSADVFKNVNHFSKMHLYATASLIISDPTNKIFSKQIRITCIDQHSGAHPFWWFPVKFQVQKSKLFRNNLTLVFHVKCRQILGGDKDIGMVSLNVLELYNSARSQKYPNHVAFSLGGSRSGKPHGVIYLSYMFDQQNQDETKPAGHGVLPSAPPCPIPSAPSFPTVPLPSAPPCPIPSAPYFPENARPLEAAGGGATVLPSAPYLPEDEEF